MCNKIVVRSRNSDRHRKRPLHFDMRFSRVYSIYVIERQLFAMTGNTAHGTSWLIRRNLRDFFSVNINTNI